MWIAASATPARTSEARIAPIFVVMSWSALPISPAWTEVSAPTKSIWAKRSSSLPAGGRAHADAGGGDERTFRGRRGREPRERSGGGRPQAHRGHDDDGERKDERDGHDGAQRVHFVSSGGPSGPPSREIRLRAQAPRQTRGAEVLRGDC